VESVPASATANQVELTWADDSFVYLVRDVKEIWHKLGTSILDTVNNLAPNLSEPLLSDSEYPFDAPTSDRHTYLGETLTSLIQVDTAADFLYIVGKLRTVIWASAFKAEVNTLKNTE